MVAFTVNSVSGKWLPIHKYCLLGGYEVSVHGDPLEPHEREFVEAQLKKLRAAQPDANYFIVVERSEPFADTDPGGSGVPGTSVFLRIRAEALKGMQCSTKWFTANKEG